MNEVGSRRHLLIAGGAGVLLRLLLIVLSPSSGPEGGDSLIYHETAVELASSPDAWLDPESPFGYRAPLYFAYLAAFYLGFEQPSYHVGQVANLFLFAVVLVLLFRITGQIFGSTVATITVWLRSVHPVFFLTDLFVLSEPLFDLFLLLALWIFLKLRQDKPRLVGLLLLGMTLGAMMLVREYAQGLMLLVLAGLVWSAQKTPRTIPRLGFLVLGVAIVIAPWIWRNAEVWGEWTPVALTTGINLHIGNHPDATGGYKKFTHPDHFSPDSVKAFTPEYDRWHRARAVAYILESPGGFLTLAPRKLGHMVWPRPLRHELQESGLFSRIPRPVLSTLIVVCAVGTAGIWVLGIIGLGMREPDRYSAASWGLLAYNSVVVVAAFGHPRMSDPILLMLLSFAGYAAVNRFRILPALRGPSGKSLVTLSLIALLGILWAVMLAGKVT